MTEPADLLRRYLGLMDRAMAHEGCTADLRRRVLNRLIYGHPDGPHARETVDPDERRAQIDLADSPLFVPHQDSREPCCDDSRSFRPRPSLDPGPAEFECPRCDRVETHPDDVAAGWCAGCHDWTGGGWTHGEGATS